MNSYLTEADEMSRRYELDERRRHHVRTTPPTPRRRTRVAAGMRRLADRLEQ